MKGINLGSKNGMWAGDNVSYSKLHAWVRRHLTRPALCKCGVKKPYDVANKTNKYIRDLADWEWLCRRCHMIIDGRMEKLIKFNKSRTLADKSCPFCRKLFHPKSVKSKYCSKSCSNSGRSKHV